MDGVGDGGEGVHDVLRGAVKIVACNFKGHVLVAGRLRVMGGRGDTVFIQRRR